MFSSGLTSSAIQSNIEQPLNNNFYLMFNVLFNHALKKKII